MDTPLQSVEAKRPTTVSIGLKDLLTIFFVNSFGGGLIAEHGLIKLSVS
jgi:hypothetical protein